MHELQNFIGGTFRPPREDRWYTSDDPASGQPGTRMPNSTESDVNDAVDAAAAAFTTWSKTTLQDRSKILLLIAAGIEAQLEAFAVAESEDQGKPISVARQIDIPRAIHNFRYFGQHILTETESVSYGVPQHMSYTRKMPAGVAALISPWNLPLYLLTWKIAPCLAYGCTCVCKPSEFTSRTASMLCQVLKDAGVPDGVVNMVFGDGPSAGQPLIEHPQVPLISFTGGTVTGKRIYERAAACVKRLSLELGGKNAVLVFDDADFAKLIPTVVRSSFSNQGEICLCGSRLFVQRGVYERFVAALTEATRQLRVGHPADAATQMGPLVSKPHYEKVLG
ncbi:ALDH-like protein, partial [Caulochytrium protostelioides]